MIDVMELADKEDVSIYSRQVGEQEKRKLKSQQDNKRSIWVGFGAFGMVGWSVVVTALLGAALGIWLDKKYPQSFSWTLSCMMLGLTSGCLIAWQWITREDKDMHQNKEKKDE